MIARSQTHSFRRLVASFGVLAAAAGSALVAAPASQAAVEADYIVLYKAGTNVSAEVRSEKARGNDVQDVFRSAVKGIVAPLDRADVARLRNDSDVLLVERDGPVRALAAGPRDQSPATWGLDRIDQRALPLNNRIATDQNGFGVKAYIIDTGIRADHVEFTGRMATGFDAVGDGNGTKDCNGHGTHVAGTVGGSTYGVAPETTLVPVRVLSCDGSGWTSDVIAGVDWVTANHSPGEPAVANMSLGGGYSGAINAAVANASSDGVTMVVAAGNSSADACGFSPASASAAITVGATGSSDARASYSNYGTCVDIFAPGSGITSAWTPPPASPPTPPTAPTPPPATSPPASTSPPENDDFVDATTVTSMDPIDGTTLNASREPGEPAHVGTVYGSSKSIWYRWTAPSDGTLSLSTQGSAFDTLLAAYVGDSLGSLTAKAANDDFGGGTWSSVSFEVSSGTTYRIAVDGWFGASGTSRLLSDFVVATPTTATNTISGTSMASPHVAGAAALILSRDAKLTPAQVSGALTGVATTGVVTDRGAGSPDRLLYTGGAGAITDPVPTPDPTPTPEPEPTPEPAPDPVPGIVVPGPGAGVSRRTATMPVTCQPVTDDGNDAPCAAFLRLVTPFGDSVRGIRLEVDGSGQVSFRLSAAMARRVDQRGSVAARVIVSQAAGRAVYRVNLVKAATNSRRASRR